MIVRSCSFSSNKVLQRCQQQYHYKYEEGLRPRLKKPGLFRGSLFHELMSTYYRQEDWKERWEALKKELWDPLFDEEKENYGIEFMNEVRALMAHYLHHWEPEHAKWQILFVEKKFKLMTRFGFPVVWVSDLIFKVDGVRVLMETKAKEEIPESDERLLNPQVHGYCWLLKQKGIYIDKILWNYVRTKPVSEPKINKDGSLSKRKINTDRRTYLRVLKKAGLDKYPEYQTVAKNLPVTLSLERVVNSPNLAVGERYVRDWIELHHRAQLVKRPLRAIDWLCKGCDYLNLCQADLVGKVDRNLIIKRDYVHVDSLND